MKNGKRFSIVLRMQSYKIKLKNGKIFNKKSGVDKKSTPLSLK